MGLLGMIRESMFGNQSDLWRPVPLSTFFSEGWLKPWYNYPRSTTGVPRQAWINAYEGVFYRLWFLDFTYVNNTRQNGNAYLGSFTIFTPISQRFQFLFSVPFIQSDKGGLSNTYHGNFGDFAVSPRFLLSETQDFSQVVECIVRTPTGSTVNGNGQTTLTPQYDFWYGGLPCAGVIRGRHWRDDTDERRGGYLNGCRDTHHRSRACALRLTTTWLSASTGLRTMRPRATWSPTSRSTATPPWTTVAPGTLTSASRRPYASM